MDQHPDWPSQSVLRARAEDVIVGVPDDTLRTWFVKHRPASPMARLKLADLETADGRGDEAARLIRDVWIGSDFTPVEESLVLGRYGDRLTQDDHIKRLDRLLWDNKPGPAQDMFARVPEEWRLLATARLALAANAKSAEAAVDRVPAKLKGDPGLAFERFRWRRRNNLEDGALEILEQTKDLGRPETWWPERQTLARKLLQEGQAPRAYRLVAEHKLTEPGAYADSEFLAGWIALRFLRDPQKALDHFTRLYTAAKMPLSLSRGAYWAGRAADALGQAEVATDWFQKASAFSLTYYGELATAMPGVTPPPPPVPEPKATPEEAQAFEAQEMVHAIRILAWAGEHDALKAFMVRLSEMAAAPAQYALAADLAESLGRPDLGVLVSRRAGYNGVPLFRAGFPLIPMPRNAGAEQALLLAITRQESAFDVRAVSGSGARGLMQLMPGTASGTAKSIGVPYRLAALTSDATYNVELGQAYLDGLISDFNGSYVLAIASYNAGPGNVRKWMATNGDPRSTDVDVVDWVEEIPFSETRNYVQRVLENLQVYRLRIGDKSLAFSLDADLRR
jgi:soluble lytic murein transglycosylase